MFKIQIRTNGLMVDYDSRRFESRVDAGKALSFEVLNVVGHWADMRVTKA